MKLEDIRADRDNKIARLLRYFGVIMAIFYFVMGLTFVLLPWFGGLTTTIRYSIATLLMVYGCFRMYRIVQQFRLDK